jgi:chromosome segregation ATPase
MYEIEASDLAELIDIADERDQLEAKRRYLEAKLAEVHREYAKANNILLEAERNTNSQLTEDINKFDTKLGNVLNEKQWLEDQLQKEECLTTEWQVRAETLQAELDRLRKDVPGDIDQAVDGYFLAACGDFSSGDFSNSLEKEDELKALIGALVERVSDTEIRNKIAAGFEEGANWAAGIVKNKSDGLITNESMTYANKIIGGGGG